MQKTRTKVFNNESPAGKCIGDSKTEEQCNTNICPGKLLTSTVLSYDLVLLSNSRPFEVILFTSLHDQ